MNVPWLRIFILKMKLSAGVIINNSSKIVAQLAIILLPEFEALLIEK